MAVCEAQGSPKGPKLMIKGIKEAQGRLREAQGTEKALKGTTSVLEAGLTPTNEWIYNLFNGEDYLPSLNFKEVVQVSDDCIIIFYKSIPLSLVHFIAKTKGFI